MAQQYFTLLTTIGIAKIANAVATGTKLNITQFAVGDGNGASYTPTESMTALRREVYRANEPIVAIDDLDPNQIIVTAIIPAAVGGWFVREGAIFDGDGDMIAVGNYPESYKPVPESGSAKDMELKMIILVTNSATVNISINPNVIIATLADVQNKIIQHNTSGSAHNDIRTALADVPNKISQHNTSPTAHDERLAPLFSHIGDKGIHVHYATACTGTGSRYELVVPTLDYPLPGNFIVAFTPHVAVLANAVIVIRKSSGTPNEQSTALPIITNENEAIGAAAFAATTVIMLAIGGGRAFFKMGGAGKPPTSWQYYNKITATGNWTVPESKWYRFHIIGAGGSGGNGGARREYETNKINCGGGGGGGSGGGLAVSTLYLKAGTVIPATLSAAYTSLGAYGTALCGITGSTGGAGATNAWREAGKGGAGGTPGGTASGGNILNRTGLDGIRGSDGINYSSSTDPGPGGPGSPKLADSAYYSPQAASGQAGITLNGNVPTFGGGGSGGRGQDENYSSNTGYAGAPGGIVIEIGAA